MKTRLLFLSLGIVPLLVFVLLTSANNAPQRLILGEWTEMAWEYEGEKLLRMTDMDCEKKAAEIRESIGQHLVIHQAETWQFNQDGRLTLAGSDTERTVRWRLKGRGNILQLKYDNGTVENYSINQLGKDTMEIHFETDMQARGIAKLLFVKS